MQRAERANLFGRGSEIYGLPGHDPDALGELLLRTGLGMEGLEALIARGLGTEEQFSSVESVERSLAISIDPQMISGEIPVIDPPRQRPRRDLPVASIFYIRLLNGAVRCRCMTTQYPASNANWGHWERLLWTMRRIRWRPEWHAIFPRRFQQRIRLLLQIGHRLGLQPMWNRNMLPFLPVAEVVEPPRTPSLPLEPPRTASSAGTVFQLQ